MKKLLISCILLTACATTQKPQYDYSNYSCDEIAANIKVTQNAMNNYANKQMFDTVFIGVMASQGQKYYYDYEEPNFDERLSALQVAKEIKKCQGGK